MTVAAAPETAFEDVAFGALPGWADDDHLAAFAALQASAVAVAANGDSRQPLLVEMARRLQACASAITTRGEARTFFEAHFRPARVRHAGPPGLLTGYYEPILKGALTPDATFTVPVYRRPPDLENVVSESERGAKSSGLTHVRRTAGGVTPYATRREIELGALTGQNLELVYLADPVETFFLHVQGSGAVRLPDGTLLRITYDGKNGHPYTSVGREMIKDGLFKADDLTLQVMGDWLRANPERARPMLWRNESFVFFRPLDASGPIGVLGTPLHAGRSLAVDTAYHALGLPVYVSAPSMTHVAATGLNRLMIAHDVGSAIKGPERGDVYFGSGLDALALAGVTKHPVDFYVLIPVAVP